MSEKNIFSRRDILRGAIKAAVGGATVMYVGTGRPTNVEAQANHSEVLDSTNPVLLLSNEGSIAIVDVVTQDRQELTQGYYPTWSPDGNSVSYISLPETQKLKPESDNDAVGNINIYDTETKESTTIAEGNFLRAIFSPKGDFIAALEKLDNGNEQLVIVDIEEESITRIEGSEYNYGDHDLRWNTDGIIYSEAITRETATLVGVEYDSQQSHLKENPYPNNQRDAFISKNGDAATNIDGGSVKITPGFVIIKEGKLIPHTNPWRPRPTK